MDVIAIPPVKIMSGFRRSIFETIESICPFSLLHFYKIYRKFSRPENRFANEFALWLAGRNVGTAMKSSAISGSAQAQLREAILRLKSANGCIDIPAARKLFRRRLARGDTAILSLLGVLTATRVSAATTEIDPVAPLAVANSLEDLLDFGELCLPGQLYNPASDEEHDHSIVSSSSIAHGDHDSGRHNGHGDDPFASRFANQYAREHDNHGGHETHNVTFSEDHSGHGGIASHGDHQSAGTHATHGEHGSSHASHHAAAGGQDHDGHTASHKEHAGGHEAHADISSHESHTAHGGHTGGRHDHAAHTGNGHENHSAHQADHAAQSDTTANDNDTNLGNAGTDAHHHDMPHGTHHVDAHGVAPPQSAHEMTLAMMDFAGAEDLTALAPPVI